MLQRPGLTQTGDSFTAGDVLLEIETDKAQMDVEAQDDGILAKIIVRGGRAKTVDRTHIFRSKETDRKQCKSEPE
jgi:pyruvate/2-oxoglutarate dehydrogenase complex dihydrolipoamide acyltransferase (E2) component